MITNEDRLKELVHGLYTSILFEEHLTDKSGVRMAEIINATVRLNPSNSVIQLGPKKTNVEYCVKELKWYISESLSIIGHMEDIKIWNEVCSKTPEKMINSNYGWCIFSKENGYQYKHCINELMKNRYSRRAVMIYTRPSMWTDYNKDGMNDFICTDGVQCFIRHGELVYIVKQRSCDFIFGFFNDYFWHSYVCNKMYDELIMIYPDIYGCKIIYNAYSMHVYERHFGLITDIWEGYYNGNS